MPKEKLIKAFENNDMIIDYPDKTSESKKAIIEKNFAKRFTKSKKIEVSNELKRLIGVVTINSFMQRIEAKLSALPQEIRFIIRQDSYPIVFESVSDAANFLKKPEFKMLRPTESYVYQITFSDGSEFERSVSTISELRVLHDTIAKLTTHMENLFN